MILPPEARGALAWGLWANKLNAGLRAGRGPWNTVKSKLRFEKVSSGCAS